jgi:hypothetical protein
MIVMTDGTASKKMRSATTIFNSDEMELLSMLGSEGEKFADLAADVSVWVRCSKPQIERRQNALEQDRTCKGKHLYGLYLDGTNEECDLRVQVFSTIPYRQSIVSMTMQRNNITYPWKNGDELKYVAMSIMSNL